MKQTKCESCGNVQNINLVNCLECSEEMANSKYDVSENKKIKPIIEHEIIVKQKTIGGRYMPRIIIGVILIIIFLNSFATNHEPYFPKGTMNSDLGAELTGYYAGKLFLIVLAFWLVYSGVKKRDELKKKILSE